ncbi:MAG TPA: hypothetical protein VKB88_12735 [Bryobacteraceae bacterium]|nr:hypothetical protein [Bryobacteraceae bacterium]
MMEQPTLSISVRSHVAALLLIATGAGVAVYGMYAAPQRTWPNLLLDSFYCTSLALSAALFLATQRLTGARWSASLRRVPEAFMMGLPAAAVMMLMLSFGCGILYPWARNPVSLPAIAGEARYLAPTWVLVRAICVFLLWLTLAWLMRKTSLDQDRNLGSSLILDRHLNRYSAIFVLVFAATFSVSAFDWVISLEPHWFSTMFAFYVFAGTFVQGIAGITLAAVMLKEQGAPGNVVRDNQLRDLGKMVFAFATFWAYIWTCQYLLIWYGDIPDEVTHYAIRTNEHWIGLFILNLLINWLVPFVCLMSARSKSSVTTLKIVSVVLLIGHWLDLYLLIMPAFFRVPQFGAPELAIAIAYGAVLYLLFVRNLAKAPLVPVHDPVLLAEALTSRVLATWAEEEEGWSA